MYSHRIAALFALCSCTMVAAQSTGDGSCAGSIALAVVLSVIITLLLLGSGYFLWMRYWKSHRGKHLILETDAEKGNQYALDNPCFESSGMGMVDEKPSKMDPSKLKWNHISALSSIVSKNKRAADDSCIEDENTKVVELKSHDFTGLGFNIYGNMRDGIFIKDILHRGPASESGKLHQGDRIRSIRISFDNMVYEDALTILSYASPYKVQIEVQSGAKGANNTNMRDGKDLRHPVYRSVSTADLFKIGKSSHKMEVNNCSMNSLAMPRDGIVTKSPKKEDHQQRGVITKPERTKKAKKSDAPKAENNIAEKILEISPIKKMFDKMHHKEDPSAMTTTMTVNATTTTTTTVTAAPAAEINGGKKMHKFGVKVLPMGLNDALMRSPKSSEQNDNNANVERSEIAKKDSVDAPQDVAKAEVAILDVNGMTQLVHPGVEVTVEKIEEEKPFRRHDSGIKRDAAGIPQELPDHLMQVAVVAQRNRKSVEVSSEDPTLQDIQKSQKKMKGKAPAPPMEPAAEVMHNGECQITIENKTESTTNGDVKTFITVDIVESIQNADEANAVVNAVANAVVNNVVNTVVNGDAAGKDFSSDSEPETDQQSSINTIELNPADITIHQEEGIAEANGRKTASTGDLSKMTVAGVVPVAGLLERAQSLDITDAGMPQLSKKRKAVQAASPAEESAPFVKEPRLSLDLDGLGALQQHRLKKSSEWGNLEDAIVKDDDMEPDDEQDMTTMEEDDEVQEHASILSIGGEADEEGHAVSFVSTTCLRTNLGEVPEMMDDVGRSSRDFIAAEKEASRFDSCDLNICDDIKVSRHSLGSLERPKSDVLKSVNKLKLQTLLASTTAAAVEPATTDDDDDHQKTNIINVETGEPAETKRPEDASNASKEESLAEAKESTTYITEIRLPTAGQSEGDVVIVSESKSTTPEMKKVRSPTNRSPRSPDQPMGKSKIPIATLKVDLKSPRDRSEESTSRQSGGVSVMSIRSSSKIPSGQMMLQTRDGGGFEAADDKGITNIYVKNK